jgi:hypothetical protein
MELASFSWREGQFTHIRTNKRGQKNVFTEKVEKKTYEHLQCHVRRSFLFHYIYKYRVVLARRIDPLIFFFSACV